MEMTIKVDRKELFNALGEMKGDTAPLGNRIVGVLLAGDVSFSDAIGMELYGVRIVPVPKAKRSK